MRNLFLRRSVLKAIYAGTAMVLTMSTANVVHADTSVLGGVTVSAPAPGWSITPGLSLLPPANTGGGRSSGGGGGLPPAGYSPSYPVKLKKWIPPNIRANCSSGSELQAAYSTAVFGHYRLLKKIKTGQWAKVIYPNDDWEVWYVASGVASFQAQNGQGCHKAT